MQDSPSRFRTLNHSRTKCAEMVAKLIWIIFFAFIYYVYRNIYVYVSNK